MIHYHGTPFSGDMTGRLALRSRHAMISFARPDDIELAAELCQSFALDNGAFTAWKQGERFDVGEFMRWAGTWIRHPGCDFILAPDVIDGTEAENDELLEMVTPLQPWVPIWHMNETLARLSRLCLEWPRVALGSSGAFSVIGTADWWGRMTEAMNVACDHNGIPKAKLHGLRMLDPVVFSHVPFSSADSTNVARNIGIDSRWKGPYMPRSKQARALLLIDRIESHASAHRWNREASGVAQNHDLFG